jgi:hypothetical protein
MRSMRYSLSSRFRGTLLGAAIGEVSCAPKHFAYPDATKTEAQAQLLTGNVAHPKLPGVASGGRLAVLGAESLIRLGRFDLNDWRHACGKDSLLGMSFVSSEQNAINCLSTAIIATLPITLFYHENEIRLRQNLQLLIAGQDKAVSRDGALAVGYAITQSLNEKLNAATLIPQIITFLGEPETQIAQHLRQVQTLLAQRASLARAVDELSRDGSSTPIALAFYCFLSTLDDFRLSVMRAALTNYQPQITSAIAAALSGAYNTTSGIPINWRLALSRDAKLAGWGITTEAEILQYPTHLLPFGQGSTPWQHIQRMKLR